MKEISSITVLEIYLCLHDTLTKKITKKTPYAKAVFLSFCIVNLIIYM